MPDWLKGSWSVRPRRESVWRQDTYIGVKENDYVMGSFHISQRHGDVISEKC